MGLLVAIYLAVGINAYSESDPTAETLSPPTQIENPVTDIRPGDGDSW